MFRRHPPTPHPLPVLIYLWREGRFHPPLMLQPQIPPQIHRCIQDHQHRLRHTGRPTAGLNITIPLKIDHLRKRLLNLHGLLIAGPTPQILGRLARAIGRGNGDPHAHLCGKDGDAKVGAVFVGGVGGADAAHVGGHDHGGDEEGDAGGDEEDGGGPGFGVAGPGAAGDGAAGAGDGDQGVAGGEVFAEGEGHGGDHVEG